MRRLLLYGTTMLVIIILLSGCGNQSESDARDAVENYLELTKKGDPMQEMYISGASETLYDVFDYEYLDTIGEEETYYEFADTRDEFEAYYNSLTDDTYNAPTWEECMEQVHDKFGDNDDFILIEDDEGFEVKSKEKGMKKYKFLYNAEIANAGGIKIYKKIEFTVEYNYLLWNSEEEEYTEGFFITEINIR